MVVKNEDVAGQVGVLRENSQDYARWALQNELNRAIGDPSAGADQPGGHSFYLAELLRKIGANPGASSSTVGRTIWEVAPPVSSSPNFSPDRSGEGIGPVSYEEVVGLVRAGTVIVSPMDGRAHVIKEASMESGGNQSAGLDGDSQELRLAEATDEEVENEDDYVESLYE